MSVAEIFVHSIDIPQLRDVWAADISKEGIDGRVEVLSWLSKMTLDVIGQAGVLSAKFTTSKLGLSLLDAVLGFNYKFGALSGETSALSEAFSAIFESATSLPMIMILRAMFPPLRFLVSLSHLS